MPAISLYERKFLEKFRKPAPIDYNNKAELKVVDKYEGLGFLGHHHLNLDTMEETAQLTEDGLNHLNKHS